MVCVVIWNFDVVLTRTPAAEEYYKNDYPDEEDSDSDDGRVQYSVCVLAHLTYLGRHISRCHRR